jgi:hypothetical protein
VGPDDWKDYEDYSWLNALVTKYLDEGKKVLLFPNEEAFIWPARESARQVLNSFQNKSVWLVTQLGTDSRLIYRHPYQLTVKIIELQYILLQLCEEYYKGRVNQHVDIDVDSDYNFLCMTGRFEPHKGHLVKSLHDHNLNQYGLITISSDGRYPDWFRDLCSLNESLYQSPIGKYQVSKLLTHNISNFLHIEHRYKKIPMILHSETSCGLFYATEKSLWPLLLGKLYLGFGPPGNMKHIQKFYDVSFDDYLNLDFDAAPSDWSVEGQNNRIEIMIKQNKELIQDCKDVYNKFSPRLEAARWTIGKNLYNFFINQLRSIS